MSDASDNAVPTLHAAVITAFTQAFGEPAAAQGNGRQWSLYALHGVIINILLINHGTHITAWVIDPRVSIDGVQRETLTDEAQAATLIQLIANSVATAWARREDRAEEPGRDTPGASQ